MVISAVTLVLRKQCFLAQWMVASFIQRTKSCPSGAGGFQHNGKNKTKQTPAKWSADGSDPSEHGDGHRRMTWGAHREAGAQEPRSRAEGPPSPGHAGVAGD